MISFNEIIGGADSSVRVTEDGLLYAVDLVMVITAKNQRDSARVIKDLTNDIFQQVMCIFGFPVDINDLFLVLLPEKIHS